MVPSSTVSVGKQPCTKAFNSVSSLSARVVYSKKSVSIQYLVEAPLPSMGRSSDLECTVSVSVDYTIFNHLLRGPWRTRPVTQTLNHTYTHRDKISHPAVGLKFYYSCHLFFSKEEFVVNLVAPKGKTCRNADES